MGNLRAALGFSLGVLGVACQDGGDGSRRDFIAYWTDGDAWCEQLACGDLPMKKQCELSWPKTEQVEDGLELAELTKDQLAKCRASSEAYDACFYDQSCERSFVDPTMACPREFQRFDLDCSTLIEAIEMVPPGGFADEEDRGDAAANGSAAAALCDRSAECEGRSLSAAERQDCIDSTAMVLGGVPDLAGFLSCVDAMSCSALESGGAAECLEIDPESSMCVDSNTLSLCDVDLVCVIVDCDETCSGQGFSSMGCAFSSADGYDQCLCSP